MTDNTRLAILELERLYRENSNKKLSSDYFAYTDEQNERTAIEIFKYVFEEILHWSPTDVQNCMSVEVINKFHLSVPYLKLRFPRELNKRRDYFYVATIVYPDKIHGFSERDAILHLYRNVLASKTGKFPKEYFVENEGELRAKVCLQYVLGNKYFFKNVEELYETFADETKGNKLLEEYKLGKPKRFLFESCLEYAHGSLPARQREPFLYAYYNFLKECRKAKIKLLELEDMDSPDAADEAVEGIKTEEEAGKDKENSEETKEADPKGGDGTEAPADGESAVPDDE